MSAHNRHLVPMPTKRRARRSKTSAAPVAAIAPSGLKTWQTFAFLVVIAVVWHYSPEQSGHHSDDNQEPSQIVPENRDHDQEREGLPRLEA